MTIETRECPGAVRLMLVLIASLCAGVAHAALGAPYASVEADRVHMRAQHSAASHAGFVVHTLATPNGGALREFTGPDGKVFAVAWEGAGRPDLRQALGGHFDELNAVNPPRTRGGRHIPLTANEADLVVRSGGHSGAFWGVAFVPDMVPAGVSMAAIH